MEKEEKDLLDLCKDTFNGGTQLLALVAVKYYSKLLEDYEKEEISVVAEILMALSKAPNL